MTRGSFADGRSAEGCDEGAGRGLGDAAAEGIGVGLEAHRGGTGMRAQHRAPLADCGRLARVRDASRSKKLDGLSDWIADRFRRHAGNADVVRQELAGEKGLIVSLRTVERATAPLRRELLAAARATLRFETHPGEQLQIDFGERRVEIGGIAVKVFFFVATLGYSRRLHVRAYGHEL